MLLFTCCKDPFGLNVVLEAKKLARKTAQESMTIDEDVEQISTAGDEDVTKKRSASLGNIISETETESTLEEEQSVTHTYPTYTRYSVMVAPKLKELILEEPNNAKKKRPERPSLVNGIYSYRKPSEIRMSQLQPDAGNKENEDKRRSQETGVNSEIKIPNGGLSQSKTQTKNGDPVTKSKTSGTERKAEEGALVKTKSKRSLFKFNKTKKLNRSQSVSAIKVNRKQNKK